MIVNIVSRRDFADALDYGGHAGKWSKPDSPAVEIGGCLPLGTSLEQYYAEFERVAVLRPEIRQNVVHIIIAFTEQDRKLTPLKLMEVAKTVAEKLGYGSCPARWTEHRDGQTQHLHGIASAITFDGERVDRTGDRWKAQKIRRDLEIEWGLWRAPIRKGGPVLPPLPRPGDVPATALPTLAASGWHNRVVARVRQVLRPGISLPQLRDELADLGVQLELKWSKDLSKITGLGFRYEGEFEIASAVDRAFSLAGLMKQGVSYVPCRDVPLLSKPGAIVPMKSPEPIPVPALPAATVARIAASPKLLPPLRLIPKVPHVKRPKVSPLKPALQRARELACRLWDAVRSPWRFQSARGVPRVPAR
jgi:hypothetical protein